ncbi:hypothetical protein LEMLEM_LOCUS7119, partial [Lemmus lemmus]
MYSQNSSSQQVPLLMPLVFQGSDPIHRSLTSSFKENNKSFFHML